MRKFIFVLSMVLVLLMSSVNVFADEIIINIDSNKVEFNDDLGYPFIDENSRTQVPFRATLEKFGAEVDWKDEERIAVASKDEIVIEVPIDENYILVNGEEKSIDTAAVLIESRTYLPIRAVIEAFGSEVQWDQQLNTVVITTEAIDAKAIYLAANDKSYDWENYDMKAKMNMSMLIPDITGSFQTLTMDMDMNMTIFMDPIKAKINSLIRVPGMEEIAMDMYMTIDENTYAMYMKFSDQDGESQWVKQSMENPLAEFMENYSEMIEKGKELNEKYTDVKYFGKYEDEGRTLLRLESTISGEAFKELFDEYSELLDELQVEAEDMDAETLEILESIDLGDLTYIAYIDEETGQMVKAEIDLSSFVVSMLSEMSELTGLSGEQTAFLDNLKAYMTIEILNINEAEDFEIPEEALNAPEIMEMVDEETDIKIETEKEYREEEKAA